MWRLVNLMPRPTLQYAPGKSQWLFSQEVNSEYTCICIYGVELQPLQCTDYGNPYNIQGHIE